MSEIMDVMVIGDNLFMVSQRIWSNSPDDGFMLKYTMSGKEVRALCRLYEEQQPEKTAEIMAYFDDADFDEQTDAEFRLEEVDATGLDFDSDSDNDDYTGEEEDQQ